MKREQDNSDYKNFISDHEISILKRDTCYLGKTDLPLCILVRRINNFIYENSR